MLPLPTLDDERFHEITAHARKLIAKYAPEWTDYNAHDPGITFLELFAWMKEMQQFAMEQITSYQKFCRLLGVPPRRKQPAKAMLHCADSDRYLPAGTRFAADKLLFESTQAVQLVKLRLLKLTFTRGTQNTATREPIGSGRSGLQFAPFGLQPQAGDAVTFALDAPLPLQQAYGILFAIYDGYPVPRSPITDAFVPLSTLRWEVWTAEGYQPIAQVTDTTYAFLQDGAVTVTLTQPMEKTPEGYLLRAVLQTCGYETAPVLTGIWLGAIAVAQQETLCKAFAAAPADTLTIPDAAPVCPVTQVYSKSGVGWRQIDAEVQEDGTITVPQGRLTKGLRVVRVDAAFQATQIVGEGNGFPHQTFDLERTDLMASAFRLMVAENGIFYDWIPVDDFDASTPTDRHYHFAEETGILSFGDCEHGLPPEGEIRIIGCAATFAQDGNAKQGRIDHLADGTSIGRVSNAANAVGGCAAETPQEALLRFRSTQHIPERAVTDADYEALIRRAPGLRIQRVQVIPVDKMRRADGSLDENCVTVAVQPYADNGFGQLSQGYLDNLYPYLQNRQLIGTWVNIVSPAYIGITLHAQLMVHPYYRDAQQQLTQALQSYFAQEGDCFGRPILYSTIYGILDTQPCVARVESFVIEAQGSGISRNPNGDVLLPPTGMAYLKQVYWNLTVTE